MAGSSRPISDSRIRHHFHWKFWIISNCLPQYSAILNWYVVGGRSLNHHPAITYLMPIQLASHSYYIFTREVRLDIHWANYIEALLPSMHRNGIKVVYSLTRESKVNIEGIIIKSRGHNHSHFPPSK